MKESSTTRFDLLEKEVSKLTQKFLLLERRNVDPTNSGNKIGRTYYYKRQHYKDFLKDTIKVVPEIQRISKIVDQLQSNEEVARNEISQLNGRVSRLEIAQHEETDFSKYSNRIKRDTKQNLDSTAAPCSIRACAFDSKVGTNKIITEEKIPKSCKDLNNMSHVLDGFYLIQFLKKSWCITSYCLICLLSFRL